MDDAIDPLREPRATGRGHPEAERGDVPGDRDRAVRRARLPKQRLDHAVEPRLGLGLAAGTHERIDRPRRPFEQPRENLATEESSGPGEEDAWLVVPHIPLDTQPRSRQC